MSVCKRDRREGWRGKEEGREGKEREGLARENHQAGRYFQCNQEMTDSSFSFKTRKKMHLPPYNHIDHAQYFPNKQTNKKKSGAQTSPTNIHTHDK